MERYFGAANAVVVAHPDDETLWAGGFLWRYKAYRWDVICCSIPRIDPERAWRFVSACRALGADPLLLPYPENDPSVALAHLGVLDGLRDYDCILTHGPRGEYGHLHHRQVHQHVMEQATGNVLCFGYPDGDIVLDLTPEEVLSKRIALERYNHLAPYQGAMVPKWRALLHRYQDLERIPFDRETFRLARAKGGV